MVYIILAIIVCVSATVVYFIRKSVIRSNELYTKNWWKNIRRGICPECGGYGRQRSDIHNCNHCGGCGLAKKSLMVAEGVWKDYAKGKSKSELEEHEYTLTITRYG